MISTVDRKFEKHHDAIDTDIHFFTKIIKMDKMFS